MALKPVEYRPHILSYEERERLHNRRKDLYDYARHYFAAMQQGHKPNKDQRLRIRASLKELHELELEMGPDILFPVFKPSKIGSSAPKTASNSSSKPGRPSMDWRSLLVADTAFPSKVNSMKVMAEAQDLMSPEDYQAYLKGRRNAWKPIGKFNDNLGNRVYAIARKIDPVLNLLPQDIGRPIVKTGVGIVNPGTYGEMLLKATGDPIGFAGDTVNGYGVLFDRRASREDRVSSAINWALTLAPFVPKIVKGGRLAGAAIAGADSARVGVAMEAANRAGLKFPAIIQEANRVLASTEQTPTVIRARNSLSELDEYARRDGNARRSLYKNVPLNAHLPRRMPVESEGRGKPALLKSLMDELKLGSAFDSPGSLSAAHKILRVHPDSLLNDLGVRFQDRMSDQVRGEYDPTKKQIVIGRERALGDAGPVFRTRSVAYTLAHELAHHLSEFLNESQLNTLIGQFERERQNALHSYEYKHATQSRRQLIGYRYRNLEEWWAHSVEDSWRTPIRAEEVATLRGHDRMAYGAAKVIKGSLEELYRYFLRRGMKDQARAVYRELMQKKEE